MSPGKNGGTVGESKEVQARNCSSERDPTLSEEHCFAHQKATIPKASEGDRARFQDRSLIPAGSNQGSTRGGRGVLGRTIRRHQSLRHLHQTSHHLAERYPAGQTNPRRASLKPPHTKNIRSFSGPPPPPKGEPLKG